jgi:hypothetical protein
MTAGLGVALCVIISAFCSSIVCRYWACNFTLTGFITQSYRYPQIIDITTIKIIGAIIHLHAPPPPPWLGVSSWCLYADRAWNQKWQCKLRSGVNLQGALNQKDIKQGMGTFVYAYDVALHMQPSHFMLLDKSFYNMLIKPHWRKGMFKNITAGTCSHLMNSQPSLRKLSSLP